jgi:hypothetical protein
VDEAAGDNQYREHREEWPNGLYSACLRVAPGDSVSVHEVPPQRK